MHLILSYNQLIHYTHLIDMERNDANSEDSDSPRHFNRSCNEKIQQDVIASVSSSEKGYRVTKSQENLEVKSGEEELRELEKEWEKRNPRQKTQIRKRMSSQFANKNNEKDYIEPEIKSKQTPAKYREGFQFTSEIIHSEEISFEELSHSRSMKQEYKRSNMQSRKKKSQNDSEIGALVQRRKQTFQKPMKFNIILLGRAQIGKSSFIDCFLNKKFEYKPIIRDRTEQITYNTAIRQIQSLRIQLTFIDMPGYVQSSIDDYIKKVEDKINETMFNYIKNRQVALSKSQLARGSCDLVDERIHCCLYFMSGPRIDQNDWKIMKKFENLLNIIPIIGKGDTYTNKEIKEIKKMIVEKQKIQRVDWFTGEEILRQNYPQKLKYLMNGPFGKAPPFVITSCNQNYYNEQGCELVRQYRWGQFRLQNQNHTDFMLLKKMLISYFSDVLIRMTDGIQRRYEQIVIKEKISKSLQEPAFDQRERVDVNPVGGREENIQQKQTTFLSKALVAGASIISLIVLIAMASKDKGSLFRR